MFFLNKEVASSTAIGEATEGNVVVWRWLARSNFFVNEAGHPVAKSTAFDIRRDEQGAVKEPSASLFEMRDKSAGSPDEAVSFLRLLVETGRFKNIRSNSASGCINTEDVKDIEKDPKAFWLAVSEQQRANDELIHWDLGYTKDDLEKEMQDAKNALAIICRVHLQQSSSQVPALQAS